MVACLRAKPLEEVVAAAAMFAPHTAWKPVVDAALGEAAVLPRDPLAAILAGGARQVDLVVGANTGDGVSQLGGSLLTDPGHYTSLQVGGPGETWSGGPGELCRRGAEADAGEGGAEEGGRGAGGEDKVHVPAAAPVSAPAPGTCTLGRRAWGRGWTGGWWS